MACPLLGLTPLFLLGGKDMDDLDKEVSTDHLCACGQSMELTFSKGHISWVCMKCGKVEVIR
jgi:hypothetical protein